MKTSNLKAQKKALAASPDVLLEGHFYIHTGFLFKTWHLYHCKLMNTALVCRNHQNDKRPSLIINLSRVSIWNADEETHVKNSWIIYHPERSPIMCYSEREDVMKTWVTALKQVKSTLSTFDDSDIEIFTSSDDEDDVNEGYCNFLTYKKISKFLGLRKSHKYRHIVENAEFYDNTMNEQMRRNSSCYDVYSNETNCTFDGKNLTINVKVDDKETATKMMNQMLTNFSNI
eukprot:gene10297-2714_t